MFFLLLFIIQQALMLRQFFFKEINSKFSEESGMYIIFYI